MCFLKSIGKNVNVTDVRASLFVDSVDAKSETSVILQSQIVEGKKGTFAKLSTSQKIQNPF